jgi:cobaltochelatase CobS
MTATTFSSTLDEDLMKHLEQASELAGVKKPKAKATGPRTFDYPEGFKPLVAVIPMAKTALNVPVRVFKPEDWPEHLRKFIPETDEHYVFDPEATLAVVVGMMHGDRILLHGPKGSGKTTLPQQICARINMPYIRVNCKEDMESAALFGSVKYDPINGMTWVDGPIPELAKHGGLVCIDEVSRSPAGINASLMAILERNGKVYLADKPGSSDEKFINPHQWFRLVCTDNTELQGDTTGKYVGTNVQDEALIDRFNTTYRLGYLSPAHEVAIITGKVKDVDNFTAQKMVQLAGLIRNSYDSGNVGFTMSPRGLIEWGEKIAFWQSEKIAFKLAFFNKLTATDQSVVAEFYHTVFSENLR